MQAQNSLKSLKNHLNCVKFNFFHSQKVLKNFLEYIGRHKLHYKNENIERK